MSDVEQLKEQAGIAACRFVKDGMVLGLGTGSTVRYSIIEIARLITEEGMNLIGVPTSEDTRRLSEELGIPLMKIEDSGILDLTIGSDQGEDSRSEIQIDGCCGRPYQESGRTGRIRPTSRGRLRPLGSSQSGHFSNLSGTSLPEDKRFGTVRDR